MKSLFVACSLAAVCLPAQAQLSGPIVRDLGNRYYLVQCNLQQLQPDQQVLILRNGVEVGQAKVMRSQTGACTIQVNSGEARRFDVIFSPTQAGVPQPERGPSIPAAYAPAAPNQRPVAATPTANQNFFSTLQSNGRVYNLNTGQTLTP